MSFEDWSETQLAQLAQGTNLVRPSDHQSLFKYVGLAAERSWELFEQTLASCELVGSTAVALNDPFELSPVRFDDLSPKTIAAAVGYSTIGQRLRGEAEASPEERFADRKPHVAAAEKYIDNVTGYARVIAFCQRYDSPLLWSHYANSYSGACLHFLAKAFRVTRGKMGHVRYSALRPIYPLSLALRLANEKLGLNSSRPNQTLTAESESILFYRKAADWSYEEEVRIVYNANMTASAKFLPEGLVSIILGPKMSDVNAARLRGLLVKHGLNHLPVRRARLSTSSFSVEID